MPTIRRKVSEHLATQHLDEKVEPVTRKTCDVRSNSQRLSSSRVIIGLCLLASLLQLRGGSRITTAPPYAVCSHDRPAIYTVDAENSIVECIVVNGSTIVDAGSISA